ncbi:cytochrome c-type biogenesis protein [Candidatus Magnetaquicoccus inordinatus]|uniref:cytochrome c-type biogenesis protein n=1 Tax=Candidatus Magnetaquicoccus inordinatus TaxID=2496818 RepID=UPI00102C6347|nr:cytochrome c-type biogenesis protein [Candidatus Magnetaquicoccus inordinatus]
MKQQSSLLFALLSLLLALLLAAPLYSSTRNEEASEAMVRKIARDLRCAVCQNQSVYESNSDLAKDMLQIIRDKVQAGEAEHAIRDYFFQRYGDYIYLEPTTEGKNKILWWAPFVGLLLGAIALWRAILRWRTPQKESSLGNPSLLTPEMQQRINQDLDRTQL